jgi:hypothetical protein
MISTVAQALFHLKELPTIPGSKESSSAGLYRHCPRIGGNPKSHHQVTKTQRGQRINPACLDLPVMLLRAVEARLYMGEKIEGADGPKLVYTFRLVLVP